MVGESLARSVGLACLLVTFVNPAKSAKPIEMPFGSVTRVAGPRNHVLDEGADPHGKGLFLRGVEVAAYCKQRSSLQHIGVT